MENIKTDLHDQRFFTYNTTLLRYGLFENFEIRMGLEYLGNNSVSGLSPLFTGFKVNITGEEGFIPEIALLGGLDLPFTANESFKPENRAASVRVAFSHTLSQRFSLGYNLGVEWDGESVIPGYFYSIAIGAALTEKLGMFMESYGLIAEKGNSGHLLDAGFTYLVLPNFQLDISGGLGLNENAADNFLSFGLTYRFPD
jgi:hypothetical protein